MKYNGYRFRDNSVRENTKYIVITDGDLDLTNACGINSDIELESFVSECEKDGSKNRIQAIFKIEADITSTLV